MTRGFQRSRRVAQQIHRLLVELLRSEMRDPRLDAVTLTAVEVSRDLSHARVYFSLLTDDSDPEDVQAVLREAGGFLRGHLGRAMKIRHVPELKFEFDDSARRGLELSALITEAVEADEAKNRENGSES